MYTHVNINTGLFHIHTKSKGLEGNGIHFSAPGGQPEADVGTRDVCGSEAQASDV